MQFIADMHTHTLASAHAYSTVTENAAEAAKKGLKLLAVTDHCVAMPDSPHEWHFYNLKAIPRILCGVFIIRGTEANIIDYNGSIDVDEGMYSALDWIVASYHEPCCAAGTEAQHTNSYIKALQNPRINCLGHTDSPAYVYDLHEVCAACREYGKAMELNVSRIRDPNSLSNQRACEFYRKLLTVCAQEGTNIVVDSDAHFWNVIGAFEKAEALIKEVNFPHELVVNADERRMKDFIIRHRQRDIFE